MGVGAKEFVPFDPAVMAAGFAEVFQSGAELELPGQLILRNIIHYQGGEERLNGFKLLEQARLKLEGVTNIHLPSNMLILTDELRRVIRDNGGIVPDSIRLEYNDDLQRVLDGSPVGATIVRRALRVPNSKDYPWGPTMNGATTVEAAWEDVESYFRVIEEKYGAIPEVELNAIMYSFNDPVPLIDGISLHDNLPYGGVASIDHVNPDGTVVVKVGAVLGDNAAVNNSTELRAAIDVYYVTCFPDGSTEVEVIREPVKGEVLIQRMRKPEGVQAIPIQKSDGKDSGWWKVPLKEVGYRRVLSDDQLRQVGLLLTEVRKISGKDYKLEFSLTSLPGGQNALVFNECTKMAAALDLESPFIREKVINAGKIVALINDVDGVKFLESLFDNWRAGSNGHEEKIVVLGENTRREGASAAGSFAALVHALKDSPIPIVVLYEGISGEHKIRQLVEEGSKHVAVPVEVGSTASLTSGMMVDVWNDMGINIVTQLQDMSELTRGSETHTKVPRLLTLRQALASHDRWQMGGKAWPLAILEGHGFLIPRSWVISGAYFVEWLKKVDIAVFRLWEHLAEAAEAKSEASLFYQFSSIYKRLKAMNPNILPRWSEEVAVPTMVAMHGKSSLQSQLLIVRSNAIAEDDIRHPFAGMYDSVGNVSANPHDLKLAYMQVVADYFNPDPARGLVKYIWDLPVHLRREVLSRYGGPVLVQEMLTTEVSGVVMMHDQTGHARVGEELISISAELGAMGVVAGTSTKPSIEIKYDPRRRLVVSVVRRENGGTTPLTVANYLRMMKKSGATRHAAVLYPDELLQVIHLGSRAGKIFSGPQDLEFAVGNGLGTEVDHEKSTYPRRAVYLTQCRPVPIRR